MKFEFYFSFVSLQLTNCDDRGQDVHEREELDSKNASIKKVSETKGEYDGEDGD